MKQRELSVLESRWYVIPKKDSEVIKIKDFKRCLHHLTFAEISAFLKAFLLALLVRESDILMLSVHQSAVWKVLVRAKVIQKLLVSTAASGLAIVLYILVADGRDTK
jgi:hypothetical protein